MNPGNQAAASWHLERLNAAQAREILSWRYAAPYDFYNPPSDADEASLVIEFLRDDLGFHAVMGLRGEFIGFCSFGLDGQVPGGDYREPALDIGLGMRPDLTGQGLGEQFFGAILDFAMSTRPADCYRLTVADFNERALRLYRKFGFEDSDAFFDSRTGAAYTILVRRGQGR